MATFRGVSAYLQRDIVVRFSVEEGMTYFYLTDMKEALAILKGLASYFNADFIWRVAGDLEKDMNPAPKLLPYDNHFHVCEKCTMEMDDRKDNCSNADGGWKHIVCPELKPGRPE